MPTPFLTAALAAIERGHTVFPIREKQPLTRFVKGDPATSLAATAEQAEAMDAAFPTATGAGIKLPATLGVIDCDTPAAIAWAQRNLPPTFQVRTGRPGGGAHFYLALPDRLRHNPRFGPPVEFKTLGGYVVAPGSLHESGSTYKIHADIPVATIPRALATKIGPPRPSVDTEATPAERATWAAARHPDGAMLSFARAMAQAEREDANAWLRHVLPEGDDWGNRFFAAAARLGTWVGQGLIDFDDASALLTGIFDELDDGRGGDKGAAHVQRSIQRGLAAGARGVHV